MQIKVPYETFVSALATNGSVVSDRALQEEMKNTILGFKDGVISLYSFGVSLVNATPLAGAELSLEEGETAEGFIGLKHKDISDALDGFKSLKRTKVKELVFTIKTNAATLAVTEEALDPEAEDAEQYNQTSRFLIKTARIVPTVEKELSTIDLSFQGEAHDSATLLIYIQALYPTIAKQTRESTYSMMFGNEYVYTALTANVCLLENRLPDTLKGFKLVNNMVGFLQSFITGSEVFEMGKEVGDNGLITLTFKVGASVTRIKCSDMARAFDIRNFVDLPSNAISVDKVYLLDVLKRLPGGVSQVTVNVELIPQGEGTVGTFKITTPTFKQNIPVKRAKGEGSFAFAIQSDLLMSMIFSHTDLFMDDLFFYLESVDQGYTVLACTDNAQIWKTKANRLSPVRESINW